MPGLTLPIPRPPESFGLAGLPAFLPGSAWRAWLAHPARAVNVMRAHAPPAAIVNYAPQPFQVQAAHKAEALCRGRGPCH